MVVNERQKKEKKNKKNKKIIGRGSIDDEYDEESGEIIILQLIRVLILY